MRPMAVRANRDISRALTSWPKELGRMTVDAGLCVSPQSLQIRVVALPVPTLLTLRHPQLGQARGGIQAVRHP